MSITAADILSLTKRATKEWTKQRKAEERGRSRHSRVYVYSDRVNFTDVAKDILPNGYAFASGNGKYTLDKRQFYYAVRDEFLEKTGREIEAGYFSQTLLVQYMNLHPEETATWKITASPRGTLTIPNTGHDMRIPCGTIAIEEHLRQAAIDCGPFDGLDDYLIDVQWPSLAEGQRYQAVLYIEKEGFDPQLREADIASRFDLAIISCKGQSVVAARRFADHVCRVNGGVPLLIWHDMDKSGFEISMRLTSVSWEMEEKNLVKYRFQNKIDVRDLGLRLEDVHKYGLKSERFKFSGYFAPDSIATKEEQAFLRSNRPVELNAFTAPQHIECLESKLRENGLRERFIPKEAIIEKAYRRDLAIARINHAIGIVKDQAIEEARTASIPKTLRRQLKKLLQDDPQAWDQALYQLAEESLVSQDDEK
jgi:hypothetical protein